MEHLVDNSVIVKQHEKALEKCTARFEKISGSYDNLAKSDVFFRNDSHPVAKQVFKLVILGGLLFTQFTGYSTGMPDLDEFVSDTRHILIPVFSMLLFMTIISLIKSVYGAKASRFGSRIENLKALMDSRMSALSTTEGLNRKTHEIASGQFTGFDRPNDINNDIAQLFTEMTEYNRKATKLNFVLNILLCLILVPLPFVLLMSRAETIARYDAMSALLLISTGIYVYFLIDALMVMFGRYVGKLTRPLGLVLAVGYAVFLRLILGIRSETDFVSGFSLISDTDFLILCQLVFMVINALTVDFFNLSNRWLRGFDLTSTMAHKTRGSITGRAIFGLLVLIFAFGVCSLIGTGAEGKGAILLGVFLFWLANPLFKPFGSTIYEFFGRGTSILNTLFMFSLILFNSSFSVNGLDADHIASYTIFLGVYVIAGALLKPINDSTMAFEFAEHFV